MRCPVCGKSKLFYNVFKMHTSCAVCGTIYEREVGYFSSSMALNLIASELLITIFIVPLAAIRTIPLWQTLLWLSPLPFLLPVLFYRHSRSLWLCMDEYFHPRSLDHL